MPSSCIPAASAHATGLINTDPCDNATLTQPFLQWGDSNSYKLVPGGDFEGSMAGWTLTGGAAVRPGSEPFDATGSAGSSSLYLPAGGSAQSPLTCVDFAYPTFRFFAKNNGLLSTVLVSIVYKEPLLGPVTLPIGPVVLSAKWGPSLPMLTASAVQSVVNELVGQGTPQVALKFTALIGSSQIDDIYVDPHGCGSAGRQTQATWGMKRARLAPERCGAGRLFGRLVVARGYRPYERPITSSMISSLPAPIRFRRRSRHERSIPYSFM